MSLYLQLIITILNFLGIYQIQNSCYKESVKNSIGVSECLFQLQQS